MTAEDVPHGPHKIAKNGQVVIPKEILKQAGLGPGESVYLTARSGVVEVMPVSRVTDWYRQGRESGTREGRRTD